MNKICGYSCEHNKGGVCQITNCDKKIMMTTATEPQILTRWQDSTIDDLIKENLELKRKLGEADDAVEYWQIECDKRSKVLDKIKETINYYAIENEDYSKIYNQEEQEIIKLLEEIE